MTSTLKIDTIEPEGATTTLTVGESGQNTVIAGAGIKANVLKDAGGNALFTSNGSGTLSGVNSGFGSAQALISTQTASTSTSVSFTSGIDSTYKKYVFMFFNINMSDNGSKFRFQCNVDGGSGYDETMTTTMFTAYNTSNDTGSSLAYDATRDQGQGTSPQQIIGNVSNTADSSGSGELHLYNPASTTYIKNFYSRSQVTNSTNPVYATDCFVGGYVNVTGAITQIQFSTDAGTFDGTIKMYGIK